MSDKGAEPQQEQEVDLGEPVSADALDLSLTNGDKRRVESSSRNGGSHVCTKLVNVTGRMEEVL
eukprot:scaffold46516_cov183-Amphora_coffeaeformis.AAC.4